MSNLLFKAVANNNNPDKAANSTKVLSTFAVQNLNLTVFLPRNEQEAEYLGLFEADDGGKYLRLSFSHGQLVNGESVHTYGQLVMFGTLAEHLANQLIESGKRYLAIRVSGRLRIEENMKDGKRYYNNIVVAYGYSDSTGKFYTTRNNKLVVG